MLDTFVAKQRLETFRLKVKHLTEYLNAEKVEPCDHDGYIDDPYLNELVRDIHDLHDAMTP